MPAKDQLLPADCWCRDCLCPPCRPRKAIEPFVLLLSPYAPHLAEELWSRMGHSSSLAYEPWPEADESLLVVDVVKLPVQVGCFFYGGVRLCTRV